MAQSAVQSVNPTAQNLMSLARELIMTRGYAGFSFRDLSRHAGIRSASIHYHFPTKADLGMALLEQNRIEFEADLVRIEEHYPDCMHRLEAFCEIFTRTFGKGDRICLVCMLASAQDTVSDEMQIAIRLFWKKALDWLCKVLEDGQSNMEIARELSPRQAAQTLLSGLEGAMLTARSFRDPAMLNQTARFLLDAIKSLGACK